MSKRDFYDVLGVDRDSDDKMLKSAYRKKAMQYHPDRNPGDAEAESNFKTVSEAYEALKDPQKRAAYDRFGHAAFEQGGPGAGGGGEFGSSMSDIFEDIFGDFMGGGGGGGRRGRSASNRGADLRYNLEVTLEEAFAGKTVDLDIPSSVTCENCTGSGAKPGSSPAKCGTCGGIGKVRAAQGFFTIERTCPTCQGRGEIIVDPCGECSGNGRVQEERSLAVNIPAGIEDGTRIRLAGEGEAGERSGPTGDLYIFVAIKPHDFFQRDGSDVFCRVPISMTTAALGGQFDVPTVDGGKTRVKVPESAQSGKQFRLRGKGMSILRAKGRGDMYIQIMVETPANLNRRQRELLQEFEQESTEHNNPESHGFFSRMKDFFENLGGDAT
ncbi:MAG: molecular chaperone DnaJ [Hyphomicrobiales bacterium]|nr:MAG: molecular chaperone DnaJ [Hyphomicrobiales bacterium]